MDKGIKPDRKIKAKMERMRIRWIKWMNKKPNTNEEMKFFSTHCVRIVHGIVANTNRLTWARYKAGLPATFQFTNLYTFRFIELHSTCFSNAFLFFLCVCMWVQFDLNFFYLYFLVFVFYWCKLVIWCVRVRVNNLYRKWNFSCLFFSCGEWGMNFTKPLVLIEILSGFVLIL